MKQVLILIFIFVLSHISFGQQKTIKFNSYGIENGLSQSHVTSIVQDDNGFVWIATQDGLNRFNGYEFEVFKQHLKDTNSIPNNYIHCLLNYKDKLWFGTNRGIGSIDINNLEIQKINRSNYKELKGYIFTKLGFDANDNLWALSEKHGINVINIETKDIEIISTINGYSDFSTLFFDSQKNIWVGTKSGKILKSNPPYKSFIEIQNEELIINSNINTFYQTLDSNILMCTSYGLYKIDQKNKVQYLSRKAELRYQNISSVYQESKSKIWIGSNDFGLYLLEQNKTTNKLYNYKQNPYNPSSIIDNHINTIYGDASGVVWVGTEKGVSKFDTYKQGFTTITVSNDPSEGLIDHTVWSFNEDENQQIYIGTKKDLTIYNTYKNKFYHLKRDDLKNHYLLSIYVESPQKIWCGFDDGLYVLNKNSNSDYHFTKVNFTNDVTSSNDRVYQIVKADSQKLWIGSRAGLSILNKNDFSFDFYSHSTDKNTLGEGSVKVIYRDLNGKIWIVTSTQGLYHIIQKNDDSYYFKHYEIKGYDETSGHITSILQIDKDYLWLGTYGEGIKKLNLQTKETKEYTEEDGLSNNVIYGLLNDNYGNIWISTNRGLSRFNIATEKFTNYTTNDGLQSNEFNTNAYFKASNNQLYFGGINGYTTFYPEDIKINPIPPKVTIESIIIHSKNNNDLNNIKLINIVDSQSIKLKYFQNDVSFEFFGNHFSNPKENAFKYMLEGYDEDYVLLENENKVHYMNLSSGRYTFKVYGRNPDGIWSENPTIVKIVITPPFWLTWWFVTLAVLAGLLLIYYLYRKRIDRIRRQKIKLELEVVKRTRKISNQNKQIKEQNKQVELQKAKIEHQKELLQKEKEKVENILLNILPEGTASDLINKGKSKARYYKRVSVMFTDFVGFSKIAESMKPQDLVRKLDQYFTKFDELIEKYDIEKIKTIGDSYMCAGGVPIRNKSNAIEITLAALEIQDYMKKVEEKAKVKGEDSWRVRIGINTGEVTAGVIGQKRFAYDIWGSTVNQAQRMEMHGEPGQVNVSGNTYEYIAPYFECTYRGKIQTKHNGMLDMYFVEGIKSELSEKGEGRVPNKKFWQIVDLHLYSSINYMKAERHIMQILETQLSPNLYYHSIRHTKDVVQAAERLALMEGITDEDLFLLKSAATYHDAGFVERYDANEEIGMRMAREILPKYGYTQEQIDVIDGLIKATEIPQSPKTLLQQIMCDADLDYLGRDDFHEIADLLRRELREHGKINSDRLWDEIQVKFLEQHTYFTKSAIKTRQAKKMKHLKEIKEKLKANKYKD
jgi:ligand-binding sensor domain-containing protein/class 3 adenylate cyclase